MINGIEYTLCNEIFGDRIVSRTSILAIHQGYSIYDLRKNIHFIYPFNVNLAIVIDDNIDIWENKNEGGN